MNKDRYSDRTSSSDYRNTSSRNDDSRNGSTKTRYYDTQPDNRYDRSQVATNAGLWNSNATHQQFTSINTNDLWPQKQQQDSTSAWRGNIDDNRYDRFGNNERKTAPQYQIDPQSLRTNQYISGTNSTILPTTTNRFNNTNSRW